MHRVWAWIMVCAAAATAAHAQEATRTPAGTTIVGEHDTAVGLFVAPWQEDRASDLDWPPLHTRAAPPPLDRAQLAEEIDDQRQRDARRRARLQDRD